VGDLVGQLALVAGLILLNAAFSGSEFALVTLREGQLHRLERAGGAGAVAARLAREPNRLLGTIQLGVTLTGFLASATAAVVLAEPLVGYLEPLGRAARPTAVVLVTSLLTLLTLVVGELAPKRIALVHAEGWALRAARPLAGLARLLSPVLWLLSHATDAVVRPFGVRPRTARGREVAAEVRDLIDTGGPWSRAQRHLLVGALEVGERTLRQVVVPRTDVVAFPGDLPAEEALAGLVASGHSRAPVYTDRFDAAAATVSLIDLVGASGTVDRHAIPALLLPETLGVVDALRRLQSARRSMALVVDEYGGVEGIVTVEDLLEEVVGEIEDEHDRPVAGVVERVGHLRVPGRFAVHDLVDLGVEPPEVQATTVGGLVAELLGRLPEVGDAVELPDARLQVRRVSGRAVTEVVIEPRGAPRPERR
jgi:putative hemolysin